MKYVPRALAPTISALSLVASFACSNSPPPSCEAAVRHVATLQPSLDVPDNVAKCLREKWTTTARACIVRATSTNEVTACMTGRENPDPPLDGVASESASRVRTPNRPAKGAVSGGGPYGSVDEARLSLNAIEKANMMMFAEEGHFVAGTVGATPSVPCCSSPDHRCEPRTSDWAGAWGRLAFEMTSPFAFRYSYRSDGQTYEARAVGDLDCDGTEITFALRGRIVGGNPVVELVKPSNAD